MGSDDQVTTPMIEERIRAGAAPSDLHDEIDRASDNVLRSTRLMLTEALGRAEVGEQAYMRELRKVEALARALYRVGNWKEFYDNNRAEWEREHDEPLTVARFVVVTLDECGVRV